MHKLFIFFLLGYLYLYVANLANPSGYMNIFNGYIFLTKTYTRKSNFSPSIKKGFKIYSCKITLLFLLSPSYLLVKKIPLPWH